MKRKLVLIAFLIVVSTVLVAIPTVSATIREVGPGKTYSTIQAAVNAAIAGDTIQVYPGTYTESVVVSTNNIIVRSNTLHGAVVDPPGAGDCFTVTANQVTIYGFELTGTTDGYGIGFSGSYNTFSYNKIHDIDSGGTGGGICCWDTGAAGPSNHNTISNNEIYDVTADGILTGCCRIDAVMDGNIITGNKIYNFATQDGWNPAIEEVNGENYVISNNEITGSTQYYGILHTSWNGISQGGNTISGNTITGLTAGAAICMMADTGEGSGFGGVIHGFTPPPAVVAVMDSTIEGNNLFGNNHGILLYALGGSTTTAQISGIEVLNNNIYNNLQNGIYLRTRYGNGEITDNLFKCNDLTGNNDGVKIVDNNPGDTLTNNIFECNNIFGNVAYGIENLATTLIDAEGNWWGDKTGPQHPSNPGGHGDIVTNNVDFDPWLTHLACAPVGGEWTPINTLAVMSRLTTYVAMVAALTGSFVYIRRKTKHF